jgi:integrase
MYAAQAKAGASARTQQLAGIVLSKALKSAVKLRLVPVNVARDVEKPRPGRKEMQVWSKIQVDVFLREAEADRLHALYVVAIASGMREGELFGLEWSDIDFAAAALSVNRTLEEIGGELRTKEPKTAKSRRRIDLPRFAVEALQDHRKAMLAEGHAAGRVFCDQKGGYLRVSNVRRRSFLAIIGRVNAKATEEAEKVGNQPALLPVIRFHDLRHTAATLLLLQGVHPKVVSERLGHADVTITLNTYSHVLPTMQKEAAEKLDRLFG